MMLCVKIREETDMHDTVKYKKELLELLYRIDKQLSQAGIQYCAVFGTCLGAVRENRIIPWDDDIDIAVWRSDYKKVIKILNESPEQLFVADMGYKFSRIFNRVTSVTGLEKRRAYVDLDVIDYAPNSRLRFYWDAFWHVGIGRIIKRRKRSAANSLPASNSHPLLYLLVDILCLPLYFLPMKVLCSIAEWLYASNKCSSWIKLSFDGNRKRYPASAFSSFENVPFNEMLIPVPVGYDEYLTMCYGDWRTPPKSEDRYSHAFDRGGTKWTVELPKDAERCVR